MSDNRTVINLKDLRQCPLPPEDATKEEVRKWMADQKYCCGSIMIQKYDENTLVSNPPIREWNYLCNKCGKIISAR